MDRRKLLRSVGTLAATGLTGCTFPVINDGKEVRDTRASERVEGRWAMHHRTAGNTRRTDRRAPTSKPKRGWERGLPDRFPSDPIVDDSLVFLPAEPDGERITTTIEAATGTRTTAPAIDGTTGEPMALADDVVITMQSAADGVSLCGRDRTDGTCRWSITKSWAPVPFMTIRDGIGYVPTIGQSKIAAIELDSGSVRWTFETVGPLWSVAASEDVVAFTAGGGDYVFVLDAENGERQWHQQFDKWVSNQVVLADETIVVGTGAGRLQAFDPAGNRRWSVPESNAISSLARVGNAIYYGTTKKVTRIDLATGETLGETTGIPPVTGLTVAGEDLVLAHEDRLTALRRDGFERRWTVQLDQPFMGTGPTVVENTVFATTSPKDGEGPNSTLVAFREP